MMVRAEVMENEKYGNLAFSENHGNNKMAVKLWNKDSTLLISDLPPNSMNARSTEHHNNIDFRRRIRPSFNRGKTVVLAVDPEQHIQLAAERRKKQELRNKPKTPIRLLPIDVKPLTAIALNTKPPAKTVKKQHFHTPDISFSRALTMDTSKYDMWQNTPVTSAHQRLKSGAPELSLLHSLSVTMKNCHNAHTINKLANFCKMASSDVGAPDNFIAEALHMREQLESQRLSRQRKPMTGRGINLDTPPDTTTQRGLELLLQSQQLYSKRPEQVVNKTMKSTSKASKVTKTVYCKSNDENCTFSSRYDSELPMIERISQSLPPLGGRSSELPSPASSRETRTTLVIHLPDIDYTPATPPQPAVESRYHTKPINSSVIAHKACKQRELKRKELSNLFTDITELNNVNEEINNILHKYYGNLDF